MPKAYSRAGVEQPVPPKPQNIEPVPMRSEEPAVEVSEQPNEEIQKLDLNWLPFAAKTYHISANIEDYVILNMPMMPSDIPNRNGIAFPIQELVKYQPPPVTRQVFRAFTGTPVHLEHQNEDCTTALGVVLDTTLTKITGYNGGAHWKVMGLIAVDKHKYPDIAKKMLSGELSTGSMGAMAESFSCSICGAEAFRDPWKNCGHIKSTGQVNWTPIKAANGDMQIAYLNAHNLSPIEFSLVADPAWCIAAADGLPFMW